MPTRPIWMRQLTKPSAIFLTTAHLAQLLIQRRLRQPTVVLHYRTLSDDTKTPREFPSFSEMASCSGWPILKINMHPPLCGPGCPYGVSVTIALRELIPGTFSSFLIQLENLDMCCFMMSLTRKSSDNLNAAERRPGS